MKNDGHKDGNSALTLCRVCGCTINENLNGTGKQIQLNAELDPHYLLASTSSELTTANTRPTLAHMTSTSSVPHKRSIDGATLGNNKQQPQISTFCLSSSSSSTASSSAFTPGSIVGSMDSGCVGRHHHHKHCSDQRQFHAKNSEKYEKPHHGSTSTTFSTGSVLSNSSADGVYCNCCYCLNSGTLCNCFREELAIHGAPNLHYDNNYTLTPTALIPSTEVDISSQRLASSSNASQQALSSLSNMTSSGSTSATLVGSPTFGNARGIVGSNPSTTEERNAPVTTKANDAPETSTTGAFFSITAESMDSPAVSESLGEAGNHSTSRLETTNSDNTSANFSEQRRSNQDENCSTHQQRLQLFSASNSNEKHALEMDALKENNLSKSSASAASLTNSFSISQQSDSNQQQHCAFSPTTLPLTSSSIAPGAVSVASTASSMFACTQMACSQMICNPLRQMVSQNRRRYQADGFNLDLTYITDRIIAMGYPANATEAIYRNSMANTVKFLEHYHPGRYKVFNLRGQYVYDTSKFHNRVVSFEMTDHHPPRLELMAPFCREVHDYLDADPRNVVAVHCKAGKGRTGVMICAYLCYIAFYRTPRQNMDYYSIIRTHNNKGVTIPSQRRYVYYFAHLRGKKLNYMPLRTELIGIYLEKPPKLIGKLSKLSKSALKVRVTNGDVDVFIGEDLWLTNEQLDEEDEMHRRYPIMVGNDQHDPTNPQQPNHDCVSRRCYGWTVPSTSRVFLEGDVKISIVQKSQLKVLNVNQETKKVGHIWFNTMFSCPGFCGGQYIHGDEAYPYPGNGESSIVRRVLRQRSSKAAAASTDDTACREFATTVAEEMAATKSASLDASPYPQQRQHYFTNNSNRNVYVSSEWPDGKKQELPHCALHLSENQLSFEQKHPHEQQKLAQRNQQRQRNRDGGNKRGNNQAANAWEFERCNNDDKNNLMLKKDFEISQTSAPPVILADGEVSFFAQNNDPLCRNCGRKKIANKFSNRRAANSVESAPSNCCDFPSTSDIGGCLSVISTNKLHNESQSDVAAIHITSPLATRNVNAPPSFYQHMNDMNDSDSDEDNNNSAKSNHINSDSDCEAKHHTILLADGLKFEKAKNGKENARKENITTKAFNSLSTSSSTTSSSVISTSSASNTSISSSDSSSRHIVRACNNTSKPAHYQKEHQQRSEQRARRKKSHHFIASTSAYKRACECDERNRKASAGKNFRSKTALSSESFSSAPDPSLSTLLAQKLNGINRRRSPVNATCSQETNSWEDCSCCDANETASQAAPRTHGRRLLQPCRISLDNLKKKQFEEEIVVDEPPGLEKHCPRRTLKQIYPNGRQAPRYGIVEILREAYRKNLINDFYNTRRISQQGAGGTLMPKSPVGRPQADVQPRCVMRRAEEHVAIYGVQEIDKAHKSKDLDMAFKVYVVTKCLDEVNVGEMQLANAFLDATYQKQMGKDHKKREKMELRQKKILHHQQQQKEQQQQAAHDDLITTAVNILDTNPLHKKKSQQQQDVTEQQEFETITPANRAFANANIIVAPGYGNGYGVATDSSSVSTTTSSSQCSSSVPDVSINDFEEDPRLSHPHLKKYFFRQRVTSQSRHPNIHYHCPLRPHNPIICAKYASADCANSNCKSRSIRGRIYEDSVANSKNGRDSYGGSSSSGSSHNDTLTEVDRGPLKLKLAQPDGTVSKFSDSAPSALPLTIPNSALVVDSSTVLGGVASAPGLLCKHDTTDLHLHGNNEETILENKAEEAENFVDINHTNLPSYVMNKNSAFTGFDFSMLPSASQIPTKILTVSSTNKLGTTRNSATFSLASESSSNTSCFGETTTTLSSSMGSVVALSELESPQPAADYGNFAIFNKQAIPPAVEDYGTASDGNFIESEFIGSQQQLLCDNCAKKCEIALAKETTNEPLTTVNYNNTTITTPTRTVMDDEMSSGSGGGSRSTGLAHDRSVTMTQNNYDHAKFHHQPQQLK